MSNRRDRYNQAQKSIRKFYEEDFIILVTHLVSNGIMSQPEIATLLGVDQSSISRRINRYRGEDDE
jgi:predicted XRE-type DNA-binding protein